MCGIVGIIRPLGLRPEEPARVVLSMRDALTHRGPDDATSEVCDGWVALGHRRLSIIDVGGSRQPLRSEDGNVVTVFNGEIYNFRELRRELVAHGHVFATEGDGETIVHGFEQWGLGLLARLEGMFAFIVVDREKGRVVVARDRAGIKPLFWTEQDGAVLVGSEIKSLLAHPSLERRASGHGLAHGLSRMHVPWPYTAFAGVFRLPPGAYLVIERDGRRDVKRFAYPDRTPAVRSPPGVVDAAHRLLRGVVEKQMVADVPVGAFLSGGIDSTLVVALMRDLGVSPLHTFSLGVDRASDDETSVARRTAARLRTNHHEIRLQELRFEDLEELPRMFDEPFAEVSAIGVMLLSRFARQHVKVALSGDGGDEVFAGYETYRYVRAAAFARRALGRPLAGALTAFAVSTLAARPRADAVRRALRFAALVNLDPASAHRTLSRLAWVGGSDERVADDALSARLDAAYWSGDPPTDALRASMATDWLERLPNAMLTKVDVASMQSSLEVRVPFLDDALVRFAGTLADRDLASLRWGKVVLRRVLERLMPDGPAWDKKRGFVLPIDRWMSADPVRARLREILGDGARELAALQGVDAIAEWNAFERRSSTLSKGTAAMRLLWLVTVALWAHRFKPEPPRENEPFPPFA